nr:DUF6850 family outer membrane beta-barrel protein [Chryseobacterium aureum]
MDRKLAFFHYLLGAEKEFVVKPSRKLAVGLSQNLYVPLEKEFNYQPYQSTKENIFATKIAQPDFAYDATPKIDLKCNVSYIFDQKKIRYELFGNFSQTWLLNSTYKRQAEYNGRANHVVLAGLNVYY